MSYKSNQVIWFLIGIGAVTAAAPADEALPNSSSMLPAMVDEMTRSMDLQLEDLEKPYFVQYTVDDSINYAISATLGTITSSERDRSRRFYSQVRVGSYELDNTNFSDSDSSFFFGGLGGTRGHALPLEDDYLGVRQSIWRASDEQYKEAVETLTKKRAYMKDKKIEDRPNDFSKAEPVQITEPTAELRFDSEVWKNNLKRITGVFRNVEDIQESQAQLLVAAQNTYVVNSDGTRLRFADMGAMLVISAKTQAQDGMKVADKLSYFGAETADFPSIGEITEDIKEMVSALRNRATAPKLEQYTGPVLFDGQATGQMFRKMLAEGVSGQVDPIGTQRGASPGANSLEKKLGKRILPSSFQVYDDPTVSKIGDTILLGHYRYDDEGVVAQRVNIVQNGKLEGMALSRAPTKKLSGSNGHGRRNPGRDTINAGIGCLFVKDDQGEPEDELKAALIEAAKDNDLEYGLRVASLQTAGIGSSPSDFFSFFMRMRRGGGQPLLPDPVAVYKVYVDDGREELVRGCEFGQITVASLRRILAAGNRATVHNYIEVGFGGATPPSTIVAPAVLFEELDLSKIEEEQPTLPILRAPIGRNGA